MVKKTIDDAKLNIKNIVENSTVEKKPVAEIINNNKITDSKPN